MTEKKCAHGWRTGGVGLRPPQRKLSDLFKFSKPKTPGYEISKDYYLSVLASVSRLPSPRQVMSPKGENGAVPGMLAPLGASAKAELEQPMERGVYALASVDQKSVLKLMVMPRDEAGFDPEPFLRSTMGQACSPEVRNRIAATWTVMQLTFEAFDPSILPALDFFLLSARRLGELSGGVVADPICQRYLLPGEVIQSPRRHPDLDPREHIVVQRGSSLRTRGLLKFGISELELQSTSEVAERFLMDACDSMLRGNVHSPGDKVGPFVVHKSPDQLEYEGIPTVELVLPSGSNIDVALANWYSR